MSNCVAAEESNAAAGAVESRVRCGTGGERAARCTSLAGFVKRYLKLRDQLALETVEWDPADRSLYIYAVRREVRRGRKR